MIVPRVAVVLLFGASALAARSTLECSARAASAPIRAEGVTELLSDIVITCTGGERVASHRLLPQVNIRIGTQPAMEITSSGRAARPRINTRRRQAINRSSPESARRIPARLNRTAPEPMIRIRP